MASAELIEKINTILAEEFEKEVDTITPDANIKSTLDLGSLELVDMVALIEGEFGVKIQGEDVGKILTFQDLYEYITEHQA